MYTYSRKKPKALFRNVEDMLRSKWVYEKSKYVKLEDQIDWDALCTILEPAYCHNNGRASLDTRMMMWLEILKHMLWGISDVRLVHQLQTNIEFQYFCGIRYMDENTRLEPSSLSHFRTRLSKHPELTDKIQNIHLVETIKRLPKKVQWQYDQDSTIVHENIKYPHDIDLLNDVVQKGAHLLNKYKTEGWKQFENLVAKGKKLASKLHLTYNFSRGKWKLCFQETKKQMIRYAEKMTKTLQTWFDKLKYVSHKTNKNLKFKKNQLKEFLETSQTIISQQKQLARQKAKGMKQSVKNRIVSLSRNYVRPIMKGKKWVKVQFGWKVHIGQIGGKVAVYAWFSWENAHDSKYIKNGVEIVEKARWKPPSEVGYDKWWRSQEAYEYLESRWIKNYIQGSPHRKKLKKTTRKRLYNRRAFNEAVINDVKNNRGVNNNQYSRNNTKWNIIMGCMASNYIRVR